MGGQEDILRRKQLSTTALHNLKKIWMRKNRIREHVQLKLYKTIVKPVLMYNSQNWGVTVNDEHNLNSLHRQQLTATLHIKFSHVISNSDLYQRTNEIPLALTIFKNRWKLFGHTLRRHPQAPAQLSMRHYFSPAHITLPITLNKDLVRSIEHFSFSQRYVVYKDFSLCRT